MTTPYGIPRLLRAALRLSVLLIALLLVSRVAYSQTSESDLKAAFIYKFALFTEWPDTTYRAGNAPLVIGVLGADSIADALATITRGKSLASHPFEIRKVNPRDALKDIKDIQVLFVAASQAPKLEEIRARIGTSPVLTIGESPHFAENGGVLNFYPENGGIRFEVNPDAAKRARLGVASQILRLGKNVKDRKG